MAEIGHEVAVATEELVVAGGAFLLPVAVRRDELVVDAGRPRRRDLATELIEAGVRETIRHQAVRAQAEEARDRGVRVDAAARAQVADAASSPGGEHADSRS